MQVSVSTTRSTRCGPAVRADRVALTDPGKIAPRLVGLAVIVALSNLTGWASGTQWLISVRPGLPSMVPATALLILMTSFGLLILQRQPNCAWRSGAAPAAVAVMLVTAAIGCCYLLGHSPSPLVLATSGGETMFSLPSFMTSSLIFSLACGALMLTRKSLVIAAQCVGLVVFFIALLNLGGYLLQDTFLFQVLPRKGTSIFTTSALMLLALALLFTLPGQGIMAAITGNLPGARISRRLLAAALLVPILAGTVVSSGASIVSYEAESMLILFVWTVILLFLIIVWRLAMRLAASDRERAAAQAELERAVHDLQTEHQSKDMFMATLAHELRNPLAPISAAAEVLKYGGGVTESDRKRLGEIIAGQSANLVNLVSDLMDMERLRTGRLALTREPVDVRKAISAAVEQLAPALHKRGHQYSSDLPVVPVCVSGDLQRLTQVFANLLGNAAKYTAPGGTIGLQASRDRHSVQVTVSDNGAGMDAELLAYLFEPYVQAQLTPDRSSGGLGLGLALVKKLTELHGGTVTAHSDGTGRGSSFTVTLPLRDAR